MSTFQKTEMKSGKHKGPQPKTLPVLVEEGNRRGKGRYNWARHMDISGYPVPPESPVYGHGSRQQHRRLLLLARKAKRQGYKNLDHKERALRIKR